MPERVSRRVQNTQRHAARGDLVSVSEKSVHRVGFDGLTEPPRAARLFVAAIHHTRLPAVRCDRNAVTRLKMEVAAYVISVIVRVDDERHALGGDARAEEQRLRLLDVAAETGVDKDRGFAPYEHHIGAWKGPLEEVEPGGLSHVAV